MENSINTKNMLSTIRNAGIALAILMGVRGDTSAANNSNIDTSVPGYCRYVPQDNSMTIFNNRFELINQEYNLHIDSRSVDFDMKIDNAQNNLIEVISELRRIEPNVFESINPLITIVNNNSGNYVTDVIIDNEVESGVFFEIDTLLDLKSEDQYKKLSAFRSVTEELLHYTQNNNYADQIVRLETSSQRLDNYFKEFSVQIYLFQAVKKIREESNLLDSVDPSYDIYPSENPLSNINTHIPFIRYDSNGLLYDRYNYLSPYHLGHFMAINLDKSGIVTNTASAIDIQEQLFNYLSEAGTPSLNEFFNSIGIDYYSSVFSGATEMSSYGGSNIYPAEISNIPLTSTFHITPDNDIAPILFPNNVGDQISGFYINRSNDLINTGERNIEIISQNPDTLDIEVMEIEPGETLPTDRIFMFTSDTNVLSNQNYNNGIINRILEDTSELLTPQNLEVISEFASQGGKLERHGMYLVRSESEFFSQFKVELEWGEDIVIFGENYKIVPIGNEMNVDINNFLDDFYLILPGQVNINNDYNGTESLDNNFNIPINNPLNQEQIIDIESFLASLPEGYIASISILDSENNNTVYNTENQTYNFKEGDRIVHYEFFYDPLDNEELINSINAIFPGEDFTNFDYIINIGMDGNYFIIVTDNSITYSINISENQVQQVTYFTDDGDNRSQYTCEWSDSNASLLIDNLNDEIVNLTAIQE